MIKANELRIGNWLFGMFNTNDGFIMQPLEISPDVISEIYEGVSDYQPIPITEEWLLRFGFEKKKLYPHIPTNDDYELTKWANQRDICFLYLSKFKTLSCLANDVGESSTVRFDIKYVHQLQNLYFAITGEEL